MHLKIYPVIYALTFVLLLARSSLPPQASLSLRSIVGGTAQTVTCQLTLLVCIVDRKVWQFGLVSFATFVGLSALMFYMYVLGRADVSLNFAYLRSYGFIFLDESYLYRTHSFLCFSADT